MDNKHNAESRSLLEDPAEPRHNYGAAPITPSTAAQADRSDRGDAVANGPPNDDMASHRDEDSDYNMPKRATSSRWLRRRLFIISTFFTTTVLLFWYFGAFGQRPYPHRPREDDPQEFNSSLVITLPEYGSFQGRALIEDYKVTTTFEDEVDAWLGVPYSTQPVGKDRFKPVTWPEPFEGVREATNNGPACWQDVYGSLDQSEACLTLSIYRPSSVPLEEKLPVLVYLHGGSFVGGSHRSFDGSLFVYRSKQPLMVVTVQYRLGVLGSFPAAFMEEEDLLNLDIRDHRMALEFLHKYVQYFGGDKDKITLGGQSAGAHAVGIQLFHNYSSITGQPLFHRAILSSGSPTARAFPGVKYGLYQKQVTDFMDYINCDTSSASSALACLRGGEIDDISFMSKSIYNAHNYNITWPWQPVSPGPFLEKRGSTSGQDGTFFHVPTLISSTTHEGRGFVPQDLQTNRDFRRFWMTLAPGLTVADLDELEKLYPDPNARSPNGTIANSTAPSSPYAYSVHDAGFISPQYSRVSAAYGDFSYICPVQDTATELALRNVPVYKARFNTPNYSPSFMGIPHASDAPYFQGRTNTQYPAIAEIYHAYWASFVVSGDPNTYSKEGSAIWERYTGAVNGTGGGRQLVVNPRVVEMEDESEGIRMRECAWWRDPEREERLNK